MFTSLVVVVIMYIVYVVSIFVQLIEMPIDFIMQGRFEDIG